MKKLFKHNGHFCTHSHKLTSGDHLCEFFKDDASLINTLCDFVIPGLNQNEAVIIIATHSHAEDLLIALEKRAIDIPRLKAKHQLIILDARQTLNEFMVDVMPDADKFRTTIIPIIKFMMMKYPQVRAYGEMVDLLYRDGNFEATVKLENMWTDLSALYPFSLLCGYTANGLIHNQRDFATIRSTHNYQITDGMIESTR